MNDSIAFNFLFFLSQLGGLYAFWFYLFGLLLYPLTERLMIRNTIEDLNKVKEEEDEEVDIVNPRQKLYAQEGNLFRLASIIKLLYIKFYVEINFEKELKSEKFKSKSKSSKQRSDKNLRNQSDSKSQTQFSFLDVFKSLIYLFSSKDPTGNGPTERFVKKMNKTNDDRDLIYIITNISVMDYKVTELQNVVFEKKAESKELLSSLMQEVENLENQDPNESFTSDTPPPPLPVDKVEVKEEEKPKPKKKKGKYNYNRGYVMPCNRFKEKEIIKRELKKPKKKKTVKKVSTVEKPPEILPIQQVVVDPAASVKPMINNIVGRLKEENSMEILEFESIMEEEQIPFKPQSPKGQLKDFSQEYVKMMASNNAVNLNQKLPKGFKLGYYN